MKNTLSILIILALFFINALSAQETADLQNPEIKVLSRAQKNRILLRWAANTPIAWKLLNTHGYTLKRFTVTRDKKTLTSPEIKVIGVIKPAPLETWKKIIQTNNNAGIIAQAIYGESFQVTGGRKIEAIVTISEEQQQRFTFALFAADQDFNVAVKAGLGYVDNDVRPNEKYLYKLISNVPEDQKIIKDGGVFVGLEDYEPLPKPLDFTAIFNDGNVMLSWNFKILSSLYNSYNVERSQDGVHFKKINKNAYTILNPTVLDQKNGRIFYLDSVSNNVKYTYRVKGISPFGEEGPATKAVSGKAKVILKYVPHLRKKQVKNASTVELFWEFPEEGNDQISKFELNHSAKDSGPYKVVIDSIKPTQRSVVFNKLESSNYFTITAVGKQDNRRTSFSMLVQPVDSIPPAIPIGLKGTIDSLGVIKLAWTRNQEPDMLGYRIYIAHNKENEFSPLNALPQAENFFTDTVSVKNLNAKVFYRIAALDQRFNMSELSEILELVKPDFIAPTAPVFKSYQLREDTKSIAMHWAKSSSTDVKNYLLYRKKDNNSTWKLVIELGKDKDSYIDKDIEEGHLYSYTILARDIAGLESKPSPSISIGVKRLGVRPKVKGFYAKANKEKQRIELSWRYKEKNVAEFEIYRAKEKEPLRLFRMVHAKTKIVYDTNMTINTTYVYKIRAIFKNGNVSEISEIKVKY